jgi:hypothetical protein
MPVVVQQGNAALDELRPGLPPGAKLPAAMLMVEAIRIDFPRE